jgi:hypothetical protein
MSDETKSFLTDSQKWELSTYSLPKCEEAIALLEKRIKQLTNADYQSWLEKSIYDLEIYGRPVIVLLNAKLFTVGDIINYGLDRIEMIKGCGQKTTKIIKEAVLKDMPAQ